MYSLTRNEYKGLPVIIHSGNMSGYRAEMVSFPEQKFTVIALCNNSAIFPSGIAERLVDIYLDGQFAVASPSEKKSEPRLPAARSLSDNEAQRYVGTYANREGARVFKLVVKDGKFINSGLLRNEAPVTVVSENRLLVLSGMDVTELNPVFDKSGTISEIRILAKSGTPEVFVPVKPAADSPERLSEYVGTYFSEEFSANYKISLKGNSLSVQIGENLEAGLTPWYPDFFTLAGGQIKISFTRDDKGRLTGFVFNSEVDEREVKGISFQRQS